MKIFVTGAAGFIGSNFIRWSLLQHPEDEFLCVDALTYAGSLDTLEGCMHRVQFLHANIVDAEAMDCAFQTFRPDIVVNFAAESHVDRSIDNPSLFLETNIMGVQVLLDACRKYDVKRFHQVSTDEVYGDLPLDRPDLRFSEQTALHASSPYSASKASADMLVQAYYRTYELPVSISRCSNNYGPYQFPEKLIPLMVSRAYYNRRLPVYGTGKNVRDWIYVDDHCRAIDMIMRDGIAGEVYNVGGNNERNNLEIVKYICEYMGKPSSLIAYVQDRKGHDLRYAVDATKIEQTLGWKPLVTFENGMKQTIAWYLAHVEWLEDELLETI